MPFYEFSCKKCKKQYEDRCAFDPTGKYPKIVCPECGSKSKEKLISNCTFNFAQPEGTDRWNSVASGHDYRFKTNIPKVKAERAIAEAMSHMGSDPYTDTSAPDIDLDLGIHDAESRPGLT